MKKIIFYRKMRTELRADIGYLYISKKYNLSFVIARTDKFWDVTHLYSGLLVTRNCYRTIRECINYIDNEIETLWRIMNANNLIAINIFEQL